MDLNVDLGELAGEPIELYAVATVVNVACGGHAGDEITMRIAVRAALASGARIAAHPSYSDREGFGRRRAHSPPATIRADVAAQCARLARIAREEGARVELVKPHGALYHDVIADPARAQALVEGAASALGDVGFVGQGAGELLAEVQRRGFLFASEAFADRGYDAQGVLLPRGTPGALLVSPEEAVAQAKALARAGGFETLCVHGDTPGSLAIARAVRAALETEGCLPRRS